MKKKNIKQFEKVLFDLFEIKISKLKQKIGIKQMGKPLKLTREKITHSINKLQKIVSDDIIVSLARKEFAEPVLTSPGSSLKNELWRNAGNRGLCPLRRQIRSAKVGG